MDKRPGKYKGIADTLGMGVSIACAIHCVILPVFFTTLPLFGMEILKNILLETITIILFGVIGSLALLRGFNKYHHQIKPVLLFIVSMAFLIFANFCNGVTEIILKAMAISGIIVAHVLNWRYSYNCHNPAHKHLGGGQR